MANNLPTIKETWVQSWVAKSPWRREFLTTPLFLLRNLWAMESDRLQFMGLQRVAHD